MTQLFKNAAYAALTASIGAADTSLTVDITKADLFPAANTGADPVNTAGKDWFKIALEDVNGNIEIAYVRTRTLGSATMSNLLRGQEGTTAISFAAGSVVELRLTASDLQDPINLAVQATTPGKDLLWAATVDAQVQKLGSALQKQLVTAFTTTGTSTAYTITPTPAITAYSEYLSFYVKFHAASGDDPTLQISGLATPPTLVKQLTNGTYANIKNDDIPINHRSRITLLSATQALVERLPASYDNDYKASVRAATVGANITLAGSAPNTLDGVTLVANDRILVKDQTTGSQNGIYVVTTLGTGANGTWNRSPDSNQDGELTSGAIVAVEDGANYAGSQWMLTTNGTITIDTTTLTFTRKDVNYIGFRNRLTNGAMAIDQRNAGAAQTFTAAAALAYCVDRWYGYCTGANVNGQRVAGSGANKYRYQFTGAASVTGIGFGQRIESVNSIDLAGSIATLSVDLANSLLTTVNWTAYYANTDDTFGTLASPTRTQIATGSFTVDGTVKNYKTQISIPGAATTGIEVVFSVGAQTSGTWVIGNVQLEAGSSSNASDFERRPIAIEMAVCQRYHEIGTVSTTGLIASITSGNVYHMINKTFAVVKRVSPTVSLFNLTYTQCSAATAGGIDMASFSVSATASAANANIQITGGSFTATAEL